MKTKSFILFLVSFFYLTTDLFSQISCTVPESPLLTSVTVEAGSGNTMLKWDPSPSTEIAAYIIYTYFNGDGMPFDTIWDPSATACTVITTAPKYFSVSYVVAAFRNPDCVSPLSNVLSTIFCEAVIDTCKKEITVKWNAYSGYPKTVTGYRIYSSKDGGPYNELTTLSSQVVSYSFSSFETDHDYCFKVQAVLQEEYFSDSNASCISALMQRPPLWINARQTTISPEGGVTMEFNIDPLSETRKFNLEKSIGNTNNFTRINEISTNKSYVLFTDTNADTTLINFYRLIAVNNCNLPVTYSNITSNIVLEGKLIDDEVLLKWNPYYEWNGLIDNHILYVSTSSGLHEQETIAPGDTAVRIRYSDLMYNTEGSEICFILKVSEKSNPYGINGVSGSSTLCISPVESVSVPNAFTPDKNLINDYFRPVLSFIPASYLLTITDLHRKTIFVSKNHLEEWDGSFNGTPLPPGVFLWFLNVKTPSGKDISRSGSVTILINQ